jgi:hypothetical protein
MDAFRRKQIGVALGAAAGLMVTVAVFLWPLPASPAPGPQERLTLFVAASALAGVWLLLAVARLARQRFFAAEDIDGAGLTQASARARLSQAVIQNTLEQVVLASLAYAAFLGLQPPQAAGRVALCAALFSVGRLLFFIGYRFGAAARALGFALTFYPTVGLYLFILPAAATRLFQAFNRA